MELGGWVGGTWVVDLVVMGGAAAVVAGAAQANRRFPEEVPVCTP